MYRTTRFDRLQFKCFDQIEKLAQKIIVKFWTKYEKKNGFLTAVKIKRVELHGVSGFEIDGVSQKLHMNIMNTFQYC